MIFCRIPLSFRKKKWCHIYDCVIEFQLMLHIYLIPSHTINIYIHFSYMHSYFLFPAAQKRKRKWPRPSRTSLLHSLRSFWWKKKKKKKKKKTLKNWVAPLDGGRVRVGSKVGGGCHLQCVVIFEKNILTLNCIRYPALPLVHKGKPVSHRNFLILFTPYIYIYTNHNRIKGKKKIKCLFRF